MPIHDRIVKSIVSHRKEKEILQKQLALTTRTNVLYLYRIERREADSLITAVLGSKMQGPHTISEAESVAA